MRIATGGRRESGAAEPSFLFADATPEVMTSANSAEEMRPFDILASVWLWCWD